jgi:hypothetical protein
VHQTRRETVKKQILLGLSVAVIGTLTACSTPSRNVSGLRLGMVPEEVLGVMGEPYTIRAAKLYEDGNFQEVWEYIPSVFSVALFADRYDKTVWTYFDGGKLVQWGEPADFTGTSTLTESDLPAVQEFTGTPGGGRR